MRGGDCEEIRRCLDAFLDGELPEADAASVERHLAACERCRRELEEMRAAEQLLRGASAEEAAEPGEAYWRDFLPRLRERMGEDHPAAARRRWLPTIRFGRLVAPALGTAAVAVLALVLYFTHQPITAPPMPWRAEEYQGKAPAEPQGAALEAPEGEERARRAEPRESAGLPPPVPAAARHETPERVAAEVEAAPNALSALPSLSPSPPPSAPPSAPGGSGNVSGSGAIADRGAVVGEGKKGVRLGVAPTVTEKGAEPQARSLGPQREALRASGAALESAGKLRMAERQAAAEKEALADEEALAADQAGAQEFLARLSRLEDPAARARETLDFTARAEAAAESLGVACDYGLVLPFLEEASQAALPDSLAREVAAALERARAGAHTE